MLDKTLLTCKFCGRNVKTSAGGKLTYQGSDRCVASPVAKHIALPLPGVCVYCGRQVKTIAGGKLAYQGSAVCPSSPFRMHCLQD